MAWGAIAAGVMGKLGGVGRAALGFGGKVPGGVFGQKALEYGVVIPALSSVAAGAGLPFGAKPQPAAAPAGAPGMQRQQDFMYGEQPGLGPFYLPWQERKGFMDRQLESTENTAKGWQDVSRNNANLNYRAGLAANASRYQLANIDAGVRRYQTDSFAGTQRYQADSQVKIADSFAGTQRYQADSHVKIADLTSGRNLNAVYDTNATTAKIAGISANTTIKVAGIGANRDRYLADRGVEVARLGGRVPRMAVLSSVFNARY